MNGEKSAIAIPSYEECLGIEGPYFGNLVFGHIDDKHPGEFERIELKVKIVADGSEEIVTGDHVRGRTVYVMHQFMKGIGPSRHVMIATETSDNLHRSDAEDVILFDLYNPYDSYDKRKGKQSLNARLVADKYAAAHIDRVFKVEPHSDELVNAYGLDCPLEPLPSQIALAKHFRESYELGDVTVCSPDIGGYSRAEVFADLLNAKLIGLRKKRSTEVADETKVLGIVGEREDIEGRMILLRDDVIRTAGSLKGAMNVLDEYGARGYYVVATHLSLDGDARKTIANSNIKKVIGTNTIHQTFSGEGSGIYDVLDISPIIAEVVYRRSTGKSIGRYFDKFQRE